MKLEDMNKNQENMNKKLAEIKQKIAGMSWVPSGRVCLDIF